MLMNENENATRSAADKLHLKMLFEVLSNPCVNSEERRT